MADIASLGISDAFTKGKEFELVHPVDLTGLGLFVTVMGYDSEPVLNEERALLKEARSAEGRTVEERSQKVAAIMEKRPLRLAQACVLKIRGFDEGSVKTVADFTEFLSSHPDGKYFVEQIGKFAGDRVSFFRKPEKS